MQLTSREGGERESVSHGGVNLFSFKLISLEKIAGFKKNKLKGGLKIRKAQLSREGGEERVCQDWREGGREAETEGGRQAETERGRQRERERDRQQADRQRGQFHVSFLASFTGTPRSLTNRTLLL